MPIPSRSSSVTLVTLCVLLLVPCVATPAEAGVVDSLSLWGGQFDVLESNRTDELGAELRFASLVDGGDPVSWVLRPAVGVMGTSEEAFYGHVGFRLELSFSDRFTLTPQLGAGYYDRGDDKNLGGNLQFRSGIEAAVRLGGRQSLGLLFYHLSNAGIEDVNPGAESLVLTWSLAF